MILNFVEILMSVAYINPKILIWAKSRKGVDENRVESFHANYFDWEKGISKPTFNQAKKLAKILKIPFGYLYLSNPPKENVPIADLRTIGDEALNVYSVDLLEVLEDAERKQDWYRDYLTNEEADQRKFIGKYSAYDSIDVIAQDITKELKIDVKSRNKKQDILKYITDRAEEAGIVVLRNSKVGSNTHRILDVDEFRGFALNDKYAPLVFVNSVDFKSAQIFTLMHEIAHLWINVDGVSNVSVHSNIIKNDIEKLCNSVAAEVLVPKAEFLIFWEKYNDDFEKRCDKIRQRFQVSSIVIARRALDFNLISKNEFFEYYNKLKQIWKNRKEIPKKGGSFYNSFLISNSKTLTNAICDAVVSNHILIRNAASLLNVKTSTLAHYISESRI